MIPKIEACLATLARGVGKVHIIDGRLRDFICLLGDLTNTSLLRRSTPLAAPLIVQKPQLAAAQFFVPIFCLIEPGLAPFG